MPHMQPETPASTGLGRVLIVGGGSMGQAICAGMIAAGVVAPQQLTVANPGQVKREALAARYGVATVADACDALPADVIILAVKPKIVCEVAAQLSAAGTRGALVISIAAGVSTGKLAACFDAGQAIVRVMPNTPLLVGEGMSVASPGACADEAAMEKVRAIFACMGSFAVVEESLQDVVTAVSGSGPAYFELVCETLARRAQELGLEYGTARTLALQTMKGTAVLVEETGQDLPSAIEAVSSPGGTTVAALEAMRAAGLVTAVANGVSAATQRSKELGA